MDDFTRRRLARDDKVVVRCSRCGASPDECGLVSDLTGRNAVCFLCLRPDESAKLARGISPLEDDEQQRDWTEDTDGRYSGRCECPTPEGPHEPPCPRAPRAS